MDYLIKPWEYKIPILDTITKPIINNTITSIIKMNHLNMSKYNKEGTPKKRL